MTEPESTGTGFSPMGEFIALAEVLLAIGSPEKEKEDEQEAGE